MATAAAHSKRDLQRLNRFQRTLAGQERGFRIPSTELLEFLEDRTETGDFSERLHGPMFGTPSSDNADEKRRHLKDYLAAQQSGQPHVVFAKWQAEAAARDPVLADDPASINLVVPGIALSDADPPFMCYRVLIMDPDDAERIARAHVKKQPNFTRFVFQSLIATTDNDHWRSQRNHLSPVFLPKSGLSKVFPLSLSRAQACADRMSTLSKEAGEHGVQMHEFFLHEAQAQLQLALFGMDDEFMERTNKNIRNVFSGTCDDQDYGKDMCLEMMDMVGKNPAFASPVDAEVAAGNKPVFGPLSKSVADAGHDLDMDLFDQFGNMMLILFAGHDTTAHTMTWLTYEMAKNPSLQRRLQTEVDELFDGLEREGREMTYDDCVRLPFMTKCIMETLRLWTAVPNGTFRELQYDDEVKGPGGKMVHLPKGTYVQISNLLRHRNMKLWGEDADVFNPDRAWQENEVWGDHEGSFGCTNPASRRFSPFTYTPRDCLGKNFAQMEMRTILSNVFRKYSFTLSEPYANYDENRDGVLENWGITMGPRDLTPEGKKDTARRRENGQGPQMAMYLHVEPRNRMHKARL